MMKRLFQKFLVMLLALGMMLTTATPISAVWAESETRDATSTWTELTDIAAAAQTDKPVAITMTKGSDTWVLPTASATNSAPLAATVGASISDGKLSTDGEAAACGWTITEVDGKYNITNDSGLYLYVTAANNGVRISTKPGVGADWTVTSNYLTATDSNNATRYLGVYTNTPDWRCYTSINNNITGQTLQFWELETGGEAEQPIAEWEKIDEELNTGAKVVIYHPDSGMGLTAMAAGKKLVGVTGEVNDGKLGVMASMVQLDVTADDGTWTFTDPDGKYLASGSTGSELKFVDSESDLTKWTPAKQSDGTWTLTNVGAAHNGSHNQALEYFNGFTTYGMSSVSSAYKFEFYGTNGEIPTGPFSVSIEDSEHGSVTASKTEDIAYKEVITLTVTPDEGYLLDKLLFNGKEVNVGEEGTAEVTVTKDSTVSASFKEAPPTGPFTVTIEGSEHGTVTASKTEDITAGEEITLTVTAEEGYVLDKLLVNGEETAVGSDGTATVTITQDTTVSASFKEYTPEPTYNTIAEALAGAANESFTVKGVVTLVDGKNIYVQDETGGICLYFNSAPADIKLGDTVIGSGARAEYRGLPELSGASFEKSDGLSLTAKETTIGALTNSDVCTYVKLTGLTVTEVYDNSGAYSNPNITFKDANNNTIQLYRAVVGKTDGAWDVSVDDVVDLTAAVGINNSTLQLRNTLASEVVVKTNEPGPYDEVDPSKNVYELTGTLEDGDKVLIYNAKNKMGVTSEVLASYYLAGKGYDTETVSENKIIAALPADTATSEWVVKVNDDGTYSFTQGDHTLGGLVNGTHKNLVATGATYKDWTLEGPNGDDPYYYMYLGGMTSNNGHVYLEWYASRTEFTLYDTSNVSEDAFGVSFYKLARPATEEPPAPVGEDFGFTGDLETGDEVIIFNEESGKAISSEAISTNYLKGVDYTPADGVITTADTDTTWTVTVNEDGTYLFKQGDKTLGGSQNTASSGRIYNNFVLSGAQATDWTLESAGSGYHMYLGGLPSSKTGGHIYIDWYASYNEYSLVDYSNPTTGAFVFTFYKKGAEPDLGDLVTSLDDLENGATVVIYNQRHKTAISNLPNGDWYLKADPVTLQGGKIKNFTEDCLWTVVKNDDGTYSFFAYGDENRSIAVWPSTVGDNTYAEVTVDSITYPDNTWTVSKANTSNSFYIKSATVFNNNVPGYLGAYTRYGAECFSGSFTSSVNEGNMALQFYLVNPEDASEPIDDGSWDGVLEDGGQYVIYNATANAVLGLFKEANYAYDAIPTEFTTGDPKLAMPGNGAYAFTVGTTGRYYTFKVGDKYMASNNDEELYLEELKDGKVPNNAKWFLYKNGDGYVIYNKEAAYKGSNVCIEFFSSVFSGWTYKNASKDIFLFNFYKVTDDTFIHENVVQKPTVIFDCEDYKYFEQDMPVTITLDDLCEDAPDSTVTVTAGSTSYTVDEEDIEYSADKKNMTFTLLAEDIDQAGLESFKISVSATNAFGLTYTGEKSITMIDEPFFENMTPAPNSQTGDDKKPTISVRIGNVGPNPTFTMTVNETEVEAVYDTETKVLTYTPAEDMEDGRTTVYVEAKREDNVSANKQWSFTVGVAPFQQYFGQLHSHTTYSDGSGDLETALNYVASLPESANVQFVAFTDHSNYFDTVSAANPAEAVNDKNKMYPASKALWEKYKKTVATFNSKHDDIIAIAGFEMTWSGGPGHINTFDSDGLVSRNNSALNNKTNDAGMKAYYKAINDGDSLSQFNHPGSTFGTFTDFSYWNEETDDHMFLLEVGNGEGQVVNSGYYPSYEQYIVALDKGWHVAPTNNQDNHKGRWGNSNNCRDVILTNDFSEDGIYEAIRERRVYATEDKNFCLTYDVNDQPMGTIFTEIPEKLDIEVTLYDPDAKERIDKVELVTFGGVVAHTWNDPDEIAEGYLTASITPEYPYYFVRVTQGDGDLAVTAPVWSGISYDFGIESFTTESEKVYKGEAVTLKTRLFNEETTAATVKSLTYTTDGGEVLGTDTTSHALPANGTYEASFSHTFDKAKLSSVTVTAVVNFDGKDFTYTANLELDVIDRENENTVSTIADVRKASNPNDTGYRFVIEGVITSNASGYDQSTAFFDCVYIQDATGGICIFPVSGNYKVGDKVRVVGHTDFYQGEPELQVQTIEPIENADLPAVEPTAITASQLNNRSVEGKLVTLSGTVDSVEEENGLIQTIMIKDANGRVGRVFIDGYITYDKEVENCEVGTTISATGLASYDNTFNAPKGPFPRIRIRDRADVVCDSGEEPPQPPEPPAVKVDAGITKVTADPAAPAVNTKMAIKTQLFNKSDVSAKVDKIVYTIGSTKIGEDKNGYVLAKGSGAKTVSFSYKPTSAGTKTVKVTATMTIDGKKYEYTGSVKFTVKKATEPATTPAEKAPKIKAAVKAASKKVVVKWKPINGAVKYKVAYRKAGTKKWTYKDTTSTKYTIAKLKKNGMYDIKVAAIGTDGVKKWSKCKYSLISRGKLKTFKRVTGKRKAKATWSKVKSASSYQVQYSYNNKFKSPLYKNAGNKTKATLTKLTNGKKVYARVRPVKKYNDHKYYGQYSKKKWVKVK